MIRRAWNKDKWLLTPQSEHARIAGLIAASWLFPGHKPTEQVFQAIVRHDDGWKVIDEAPKVNEAGAPLAFDEMDVLDLLPIWSTCATPLFKEQRYYAARIVAGHFLTKARRSGNLARMNARKVMAIGNFIGEQQALINKCIEAAAQKRRAHPPSRSITSQDMKFVRPDTHDSGVMTAAVTDTFERDLRFMQVCDHISVLLCSEFLGETEIENVPFLEGGNSIRVARQADNLTLFLSPMPFRKPLRDHVMSYIIARRIYDSDEAVRSAVGSTKLTSNEIHIGAI